MDQLTETLVALPGVLARPDDHFLGIRPALERPGRHLHLHEFGKHFDVNAEAGQLADEFAPKRGERLTVVAISCGANFAPFFLQKMRPEQRRRTKVVLIDPPAGADTLKGLPGPAVPLLRLWSPPESFDGSWFGRKFMDGVESDRVDPAYIDMPSPELRERIAGRPVSEEEWPDYVDEMSIQGISGHSGYQMLWMTKFMEKAPRTGVMWDAAQSMVNMDVTLVACMSPGNVVIKQPLAANRWKRMLPSIKVVEADLVHPGALQYAAGFNAVLNELIN